MGVKTNSNSGGNKGKGLGGVTGTDENWVIRTFNGLTVSKQLVSGVEKERGRKIGARPSDFEFDNREGCRETSLGRTVGGRVHRIRYLFGA